MRIEGTVVKKESTVIEISNSDYHKMIMKELYELFNLKSDYFISDGNIMQNVEYHTSHSWDSDEIVRPVTKDDELNINFLKKINSELYKKLEGKK